MKIVKAFKYRLKTNSSIEHKLAAFAGANRSLWNKMLAINLERLERKDKVMYFEEMHFWSKLWKDSEEYSYLSDVPAQTLQQKLKDLSKAFKDGFDKKQKNKRLPRFKKKGLNDSFRYPQGVKVKDKMIFLPKIGYVGFFKSRDIVGTIKNTTITKKGSHWYVSIQTEFEQKEQLHPHVGKEIGLDMGVKNFVTTSEGHNILTRNPYRSFELKLKKEHQKLSRKKKGSNNSKKQKKRLARIYEKIANVRNDSLHKISTSLSKSHAKIIVENLQIKNMSKSSKGTMEEPGSNIKAKSGLNKSILDQGWRKFVDLLRYKVEWQGGELVQVSAKNTSLRCKVCGEISKANRLSQSRFKCVNCGHEDHADINAAKNILAAGHCRLACGSNLIRDRKQEPLTAHS